MTSAKAMILPAEQAGWIDDAWTKSLGDDRIPTPLGGTDGSVSIAGTWTHCADGQRRHLWDILESSREVYTEDDDVDHIEFRAAMTCVRCGIVERWEGTRSAENRSRRVDPTPIATGGLRAQMTSRDSHYSDWTSYSVHDENGAQIGQIHWARGQRGRKYFQGWFGDGPAAYRTAGTDLVEGPTPIAVLRALARARKTTQVSA